MTQKPSAALLAASKALDEIIALASTHQRPDKFTHERLEREAKSSISTEAAFSYATLGALEAISGNEPLMDMYHQNSIKLCSNSHMHMNYAGSLHHVLRLIEAAKYARIGASLAPDDLEAIQKAINYTTQSGGITMAASLVETYKKLNPSDTGGYDFLIKPSSLQKITGISDEEIMQLVQIAADFLRNKNVNFTEQELITDDDDEGFISLCFNLNLSNEEIWNLNRQLFEIMLDQVPNQSPYLSVRFGRSHAA
jgi:hypothetical protein